MRAGKRRPGENAVDEARPAAPGTTPAHPMLTLQATAGNQAVTALLAREKTKVKDETQEGRIKKGEAVPSLAEVVGERTADPDHADDAYRDLERDHYVRSFKAVLADEDAIAAIVADTLSFATKLYKGDQSKIDAIVPSDEEVAEVVRELSQAVDDAKGDERREEHLKPLIKKKLGASGKKWALADKLFSAALTGITAEARKARADQLINAAEGAAFSANVAKLKDRERKAWSAALRNLPAMTDIAAMHKGKASVPGTGGAAPDAKWKDDKNLIDDAVKLDPAATAETPLAPGDVMHQRVTDADAILKRMVEQALLGAQPPPKVKVHHQPASKFRAFQSGNEVHVASDEPTPVVVHETGHYLESKGPLENWRDIQRLLHARHEDRGGGAAKAGPSGKSEGRYRGEYAATGPYTASTYKGGDTEVMSMTLEYLANPKKFDKMLDKDPLQAAIILRALAPTAYAAEAGLRPFDQYLPS